MQSRIFPAGINLTRAVGAGMMAVVGRTLEFGVFELDLASRELRRAGVPLAVPAQAVTVIVALAERPGEIVSRHELRARLWGDHTFVDFERSLNTCVALARRALRDNAAFPCYIETLPRRGYRFVAPVRLVDKLDAARLPHERPPRTAAASSRAGRPAPWSRVLLALATLACLGQRGAATQSGRGSMAAEAREPSTAYVRGLYHARQGPGELPEAIRWLTRALQEAPEDTATGVALAGAYYRAAEAGVRSGREVLPLGRALAAAVVRREPDHAEGRLWYALARIYGDWDWTGGGEQLRRAVALAPRSVNAWRALAAYLGALGDHSGALAALETARRLDPVCLTITGERAQALYRARRFAEAARAWREMLDVREDAAPHEGLFQLHRSDGRAADAAQEALQVMRLVGVPRDVLERLVRRPPEQVALAFMSGALQHLQRAPLGAGPERLALWHAALGEDDLALGRLEQACQEHTPGLPGALHDPAFDRLRDTPRFRGIVACVKLPGPSGALRVRHTPSAPPTTALLARVARSAG